MNKPAPTNAPKAGPDRTQPAAAALRPARVKSWLTLLLERFALFPSGD